jgi:hypothetical protein
VSIRIHRFVAILLIALLSSVVAFAQTSGNKTQFCFTGANDLADSSAPHFEQYSTTIPASVGRTKLDLKSDPIARTYRTVIRREMSRGANFAGHYRVAIWGCGSSCAQFAVIDLNTGRAITVPGVDNVSGTHLGADDFLPRTDSNAWGFRFKRNSRLLVLVGEMNEDDSKDGAFYYVLKNDRLVLVHKTIAARNTCQEEKD